MRAEGRFFRVRACAVGLLVCLPLLATASGCASRSHECGRRGTVRVGGGGDSLLGSLFDGLLDGLFDDIDDATRDESPDVRPPTPSEVTRSRNQHRENRVPGRREGSE